MVAAILLWKTQAVAVNAKEVLNLGSITVTAQKQEENMQNVPISVSVFDDSSIDDKNIGSLLEMVDHVPNLILYQEGHPGFVAPSFRGIYAPATSLSSSGGLFIDGVPLLSSAGFENDLLDIAQVEVLRGPQGTIYGKGAQGGVINIISRKPDNIFRAKMSARAGEDKTAGLTFNMAGPIRKDRLFFAVSGGHFQKEGIVEHVDTGDTVDDREHWSGRGQLRWTPTDKLDLALTLSSRRDDNGAVRGNITPLFAGYFGAPAPQGHKVSSNFDAYETPETDTQSLQIHYDISDTLTLTSITANWNYKDIANEDWDFSSATIFHTIKRSEYSRQSQELRLNYTNGRLKGIMGLYYDMFDNDSRVDATGIFPGSNTDTEGTTWAAFANLTCPVTEKVSVVGGLRYERDEQEFKQNTSGLETEAQWDAFSPKLALNYQIAPSTMTYVSLAGGYRSGGFNQYATGTQYHSFDPERVWSYEIGLKNVFMDGHLIVNTAAYYMEITDMQVQENLSPAELYTTNAGEATVKGIEMEMIFNIRNGVTINAGAGINDIEFDTFNDFFGDYKGNRPPFAPEYTMNLGAQYRHAQGLYAGADLIGVGKMYFDKTNQFARDAYAVVNAKAGYETENLDIYLYAKNLLDKAYDSVGYQSGFYTFYSDPREIGVRVVCRF